MDQATKFPFFPVQLLTFRWIRLFEGLIQFGLLIMIGFLYCANHDIVSLYENKIF